MRTSSLNPICETAPMYSPRRQFGSAWTRPRSDIHRRLAYSISRSDTSRKLPRNCPQNNLFMYPRSYLVRLVCFRSKTIGNRASCQMQNENLLVCKSASGLERRSEFSPALDRFASDPDILAPVETSPPPQDFACTPGDFVTVQAAVPSAGYSMTVTAGISIADGQLLVQGKRILSQVPENVVLTAGTGLSSGQGVFLGASSPHSNSRHVFPLGVLRDLRFMCCFRFSLWWMTQRMGTSGKDIPLETQFLLLESDASHLTPEMELAGGKQTVYTVFLPILEGSFRSSLQGNENDGLELCLESGDTSVQTNGGLYSLFLHAGTNPFHVIAEAVQSVEMHMQTFRCRDKKKMPGILDWFGWCTWDAYYTNVTPDGVREGLKRLDGGGTPARYVIIDDGWQSVGTELSEFTGETTAGTQLARRLTDIKENHKFQKNGRDDEKQDDSALGLQHFVREIKEKHRLKYVYVWHAIIGYWGGIMPGVAEMEQFEAAKKYPIPSQGVLDNQPSMRVDNLTVNGLGLAHPKKVFQFFNDLHSYLAAAGVDGVKVDVQNILETLGAGVGGRVLLTRHYQRALEASVSRNFPENGCISCMSHSTDGLYSNLQTAVVRASDDFWPQDPSSPTIHIASVAYNTVFLGEFMQPDWDMFQSLHPAAEYHAAARAIGGCPIYVSDKPGNHDFKLLKRLVLPDGSTLRAQLPGRPTTDCLFTDPARDGKSLLKIWNRNRHTGVVGAFNCQGAGWCRVDKKNLVHDAPSVGITGSVYARDVDCLGEVAPHDWSGDCVVYTHRGGELIYLPKSSGCPVNLKVLEYEIYTISPIKRLPFGATFAPIGVLKMFNSGGAICTLDYQLHASEHENDSQLHASEHENDSQLQLHEGSCTKAQNFATSSVGSITQFPIASIRMEVHGYGEFGVYSSVKPRECAVDALAADFSYDSKSGLVTFVLTATEKQFQTVLIKV